MNPAPGHYKGVDRQYSRQPSGTLPAANKVKNAQVNENSAQLELILEDLNKYQQIQKQIRD